MSETAELGASGTCRAIDLTARHLWHWATVTDHVGLRVRGVLYRIELSGDPRTRVVLRVATAQPTESGGHYWSMFGELDVDQAAMVEVGDVLPPSERWVQ